jgi:hypothetical protein
MNALQEKLVGPVLLIETCFDDETCRLEPIDRSRLALAYQRFSDLEGGVRSRQPLLGR